MSKRKKWTTVLVSMLIASLLVTACSRTEEQENTEKTQEPATDTGDPFLGKYDPPIEVSTVRIIDSPKFVEGEDLDNNIWMRTISERLGIKVNNQWVVQAAQGTEKMNVTIASGDLPDIFSVNASQFNQLVEAGEIMDLTEVYEKHASPLVKSFLDEATNSLASATFDGKLMGIPQPGGLVDAAPVLWIRKDWLDKLGLSEPKTMSDVLAISEAFTTRDPDGNGQNDTTGLALMKDLYGNYGSIDGFMNSYNAAPQSWVKAEDGTLVYGSIQPEMKAALASLQDMYKNGQIDREFGVKDALKAGELAASGKLGMTYGAFYISLDQLKSSTANDPNADWEPYPIFNEEGVANPQIPALVVNGYHVVRKDAEHPEALLKMLNLYAEIQNDPVTPLDVKQAHWNANGIQTWIYAPFLTGPASPNLGYHKKVVEALNNKDETNLNSEEKIMYGYSLAMEEGTGTVDDWAYDKVFGRNSSYAVIDRYIQENLLKSGEFYGASTPTMAERMGTLKKMEIETFTKIILGDPVDSFDKFVSDWKKLGGEQITQEVNEWYISR
ncbi:extracellular solute-binding protein [Paenibacillus sp. LHD-38]|uniref:extracellular solute-binding protein n=1 Tax=Paenibacillus sp. LHD-38 TaxID=3072143 RepID=UPI00280FEA30|nr:extracellular solute-binding protein [Paenibacillus sp. LHD-38]MDQ8738800.1 extracellular solute-binding protein [Paenibacillus sp. LHD-38]